MNRNDLFGAMEWIDEKVIENSEVSNTVQYQRKFSTRTFLLVAVLCMLTIFATAAVAAKLFGLKETLVETKNPEIKSEMSLFGFTGSKEYMAATEWKAFEEGYDPDGSKLAKADPEGPQDFYIGDEYLPYSVYTQEMADKLDEIAAKYGLRLHGSAVPGNLTAIAAKLIVNNYTEFSDEAYNTMVDGTMYEDGTFSYDGVFNAEYGHLTVDYQFRCSVKGVFDPVFLNIGDIADYQEQTLVTDAGVVLVAGLSEYKAVLIAEFDSCFISINVMGGTDVGMTFDDLKDLANTFDFSVIETPYAAAEGEQDYIELSREGVVEKIPVKTVPILGSRATIAMNPAYFTHSLRKGVDTFTYEAWQGEREVYYSVYYVAQSSPSQICEKLVESYGGSYAGSHVAAVKVGGCDATQVQFEGEKESPSYQLHFILIPAENGCIVMEAQFDFEMYEGLYPMMLALFDTLKVG